TDAECDTPPEPPGFDGYRVAWERAGWAHAGNPAGERRAKADLLRWRARMLLGEATGEAAHFYEAAVLLPGVPATRAALGCAPARAGGRRRPAPGGRRRRQPVRRPGRPGLRQRAGRHRGGRRAAPAGSLLPPAPRGGPGGRPDRGVVRRPGRGPGRRRTRVRRRAV